MLSATNGREAIEVLESHQVDLVLMDVQMPVMDGLEATAIIRRREEKTERHVPIIALTAHAMKGDRERCLAAGMDDYLSKPIHTPSLLAMIEQRSERPMVDTVETGLTVLDLDELLDRVEGDRELLRRLVGMFQDGLSERLRDIQTAALQRDAAHLARAAHALKGASANLGAKALANASYALEQLGREGKLGFLDAALTRLDREVERLEEVFRELQPPVAA